MHILYDGIDNVPNWAIQLGDLWLVIGVLIGIVAIGLTVICAMRWIVSHVRIIIV